MKFSESKEINQPVEKVAALFVDPNQLNNWMDGLQSIEHISGTPGFRGSKTRMTFISGKRRMEMVETIIQRDLPNEFSVTYEANGVFNTVKNSFIKLSESQTRLVVDTEYRFRGIMKIMAFLMSGAFKKQTRKYLEDFKVFAENQ